MGNHSIFATILALDSVIQDHVSLPNTRVAPSAEIRDLFVVIPADTPVTELPNALKTSPANTRSTYAANAETAPHLSIAIPPSTPHPHLELSNATNPVPSQLETRNSLKHSK